MRGFGYGFLWEGMLFEEESEIGDGVVVIVVERGGGCWGWGE